MRSCRQGLLPKGMVYDVFRAAVPSKHDLKEKAAKKLVRAALDVNAGAVVCVCVCVCMSVRVRVLVACVLAQSGTIRFGKDSAATAAKVSPVVAYSCVARLVSCHVRTCAPSRNGQFTPNGHHLICGGVDGLVEIYDHESCKVDMSLDFQAKVSLLCAAWGQVSRWLTVVVRMPPSRVGIVVPQEDFIMCDDAVLSLACSPDSEFLATGCRNGAISVWSLTTGKKMIDFPRAHADAVAAVSFSKEGSQILSASADTLARYEPTHTRDRREGVGLL